LLEDEVFKQTMQARLERLEQMLTPQNPKVLPELVQAMLTGHT
jgi:hypothetical protein